jgi:hypothetical protein
MARNLRSLSRHLNKLFDLATFFVKLTTIGSKVHAESGRRSMANMRTWTGFSKKSALTGPRMRTTTFPTSMNQPHGANMMLRHRVLSRTPGISIKSLALTLATKRNFHPLVTRWHISY